MFYDQYPGQWSTETAPREALVANVDWSVSPNPGLLAGGFDYYPRAEEDWSGQQQEQRSFARDAQGQPVPRFCLTNSWEDLPGTLAGMKTFSTALKTGIVLAPSFSASSAGSAQPDGDQEQNDEARHMENSKVSTSPDGYIETPSSSNADCSKRISVVSSEVSFEFGSYKSRRTSTSSLPSELSVKCRDDRSLVADSESTSSSRHTSLPSSGGIDKGKTPIRSVEHEDRATLDGCSPATFPATVIRDALVPDTQYLFGAWQLTEREQAHAEMHLTQRLDCDAGSGLSLADYVYSYIYQDEKEEEAALPRVLRVVNLS